MSAAPAAGADAPLDDMTLYELRQILFGDDPNELDVDRWHRQGFVFAGTNAAAPWGLSQVRLEQQKANMMDDAQPSFSRPKQRINKIVSSPVHANATIYIVPALAQGCCSRGLCRPPFTS